MVPRGRGAAWHYSTPILRIMDREARKDEHRRAFILDCGACMRSTQGVIAAV